MLGNSIYFKQTTLVKQNQQHIETAARVGERESNLAKHFNSSDIYNTDTFQKQQLLYKYTQTDIHGGWDT